MILMVGRLEAQNIGVNEDGSTPDPSAILDIKAQDKGLLIPRLSTAQRVAIVSPAEGLMVFDTTTDSFWYYASGWTEMPNGPQDDGDWTVTGNNVTRGNEGNVGIGEVNPSSLLHLSKDNNGVEPLQVRIDTRANTYQTSITNSSSNTGVSVDFGPADPWTGPAGSASVFGGLEFTGGQLGGTMRSDYLDITFAFPVSIPANATISSIEIQIYRRAEVSGQVRDEQIRLLDNGNPTGTDQSLHDYWPGFNQSKAYDPGNNWGASSLTVDDINNGQMDSDHEDGKLVIDRETGSKNIGFLAQELMEVVPEAVSVPENPEEELYGVDYTRLIPILTKAIQERQEQIESLKEEVQQLRQERH